MAGKKYLLESLKWEDLFVFAQKKVNFLFYFRSFRPMCGVNHKSKPSQ